MPIHKDVIRKAKIVIDFTRTTNYTEPNGTTVLAPQINGLAKDLFSGLDTATVNLVLGNGTADEPSQSGTNLTLPWESTGTDFSSRSAEGLRDQVFAALDRVDLVAGITSLGVFTKTGTTSITWTQITPTLISDAHPTHSGDISVSVLDAVVNNRESYTMEGTVTGRDWLGNVIVGTTTTTVLDTVTITITGTYANGAGRGINLSGFTAGDLGISGIALGATQFRIQTDSTDGFFPANGGDTLQCFPNSNAGAFTNIDDYLDALVVVLNNPAAVTFRPQEADALNFTAERTGSGVLVITFKDDTNIPNRTLSIASQDPGIGTGAFSVATATREAPIFLTLANDPNREVIGANLGVRIFGTAIRTSGDNATTPVEFGEDLPSINFARSSIFNIDRGFIFNVSGGYTWRGDGKDCALNLTDGGNLLFDTEARDVLWGGPFRWATGVNPTVLERIPILSTPAHPFTVTRSNGGTISQSEITVPHIIGTLNRTFLIGENGARGSSPSRLIFNNDNSRTEIYSTGTGIGGASIFPVQGSNINARITVDSPNPGSSVYSVATNNKQFSGQNIIHQQGTFSFGGGTTASQAEGVAYSYNDALWVGGDFDFSGSQVSDTIEAFQPRNFIAVLANVSLNNSFNTLPTFTYANRPAGNVGSPTLGVLWDPSWEYLGASKSNIYESYLYGSRTSLTNDSTSVKGLSALAINAFSANVKPYKLNYLSSTVGLRQTDTLTDNRYESGTGWGDSNTPSNGLFLAYTKGLVPATVVAGAQLSFAPQETQWTSYTRVDGFRPYFTTLPFARDYRAQPSPTQLDGLLDVYWQNAFTTETPATLLAYTDLSYTSATNTFAVTVNDSCDTWNRFYRSIEHRFNTNAITGDPVTDDGTLNANIPGFWRRLFNRETSVNSDGETNSTEFAMSVDFAANLVMRAGTGDGAVEGISMADGFRLTFSEPSTGDTPIIEGRISFQTSTDLDDVVYRNAVLTGRQTFTIANISESIIIPSQSVTIRGNPVNTTVNCPTASAGTITLVDGCTNLVITGNASTNVIAQVTGTGTLNTGIWGSTTNRIGSITLSKNATDIDIFGTTFSGLNVTRCDIDVQNNFSSGSITDSLINGGALGTIGNIIGIGTVVTGSSVTTGASITSGALTVSGNIAEMDNVLGGTVTVGGNINEIQNMSGGTILCTGNLTNLDSTTGGTVRCDGQIRFSEIPVSLTLETTGTTFSQRTNTGERADFAFTITTGTADIIQNVTGSSGINYVQGPSTRQVIVNVPAGTELPTKDADNGTNFTDNIIINRAFDHTIIVPSGADAADTDPRVRLIVMLKTSPHTVLFNSTTPGATFNISNTDRSAGIEYVVLSGRKGSEPTQTQFTTGELDTPTSFTPTFVNRDYPTNAIIADGVATPQTYTPGTPTQLIVQTTTALLFSSTFDNQLFQEQVVQDTNFLLWFFDHPTVAIAIRSDGSQSFTIIHEDIRIRGGATGLVVADKVSTGYIRAVNTAGVEVDNKILTTGWFNPCIAPEPLSFDIGVNRAELGEELNDRRLTRQNMNRLGILAPINDNDPS